MCGICGIFHTNPIQRLERAALAEMNNRIVHRGPDDDGFYTDGNLGLAMRRLSIIDIRTGHQPIGNEDENFWIVYNGELYNHRELRKDLEARGHRYRTQSDTETILHLFAEYLAFGYIAEPETMYAGIHKLLPGHTLELDERGQIQISPYWDLEVKSDERDRPRSFYVARYRELLEECVSSHLMSDVPLGIFLSGGLDSSAVAVLTNRIRREPIETFAVGYGEEQFNELPFARRVAEHIRSKHHEVYLSREDFFQTLPRLIWHEYEPIVWPSSVSLPAWTKPIEGSHPDYCARSYVGVFRRDPYLRPYIASWRIPSCCGMEHRGPRSISTISTRLSRRPIRMSCLPREQESWREIPMPGQ